MIKTKNLLIDLKLMRLKLAKELRVPAYIIFSDATLHQMVLHKPKTHDEFSRLNGVGLQKLNKYAEIFLKVINTQN